MSDDIEIIRKRFHKAFFSVSDEEIENLWSDFSASWDASWLGPDDGMLDSFWYWLGQQRQIQSNRPRYFRRPFPGW